MRLAYPLGRFDPVDWAAKIQADHATRTETAAYEVQATDYTIRVDATAGAVTVALPPAELVPGKILVVKKIDASVNAVTVDGYLSETIDGALTVSTTTRYARWTIQSTGTEWDILST